MATSKAAPSAAEIWSTLSKIDVSDKTQEKNGLTYLSWAWAWGEMMDRYPDMTLSWKQFTRADGTTTDVIEYPGGSCAVECTVSIGDVHRTMWLPVMDYKSTAVTNPDSRAINDAKMRCMTKCFALLGLGHYIYAGEDLPTGSDAAVAAKLAHELRKQGLKLASLPGVVLSDDLKKRVNIATTNADVDKLTALIEEVKSMIEENATGGDTSGPTTGQDLAKSK